MKSLTNTQKKILDHMRKNPDKPIRRQWAGGNWSGYLSHKLEGYGKRQSVRESDVRALMCAGYLETAKDFRCQFNPIYLKSQSTSTLELPGNGLKTQIWAIFFLLMMQIPALAMPREGIVVHHTAGKSLTLEECQREHTVGRIMRGLKAFDSCGYHFIIQRDGRVIENPTRKEKKGAHAGAKANHMYGVALVGDGRKSEWNITEEQAKSFWQLQRRLGDLEIHKHNEFRQTLCPTEAVWNKLNSLRH